MNIRFEKLDITNEEALRCLVKWASDPKLYYLTTPVKDKEEVTDFGNFERLKKRYTEDSQEVDGTYIIYDEAKPIGEFSRKIDPDHLYKQIEGTSWLGLTIGEREYWGSGAAQKAMQFFEEESLNLGLRRVELGVFVFMRELIDFTRQLDIKRLRVLKTLPIGMEDTGMTLEWRSIYDKFEINWDCSLYKKSN